MAAVSLRMANPRSALTTVVGSGCVNRPAAMHATAHKRARLIYGMLTQEMQYVIYRPEH